MAKYYQGRFKPQNPYKYMGDPTNIIYPFCLTIVSLRRMIFYISSTLLYKPQYSSRSLASVFDDKGQDALTSYPSH